MERAKIQRIGAGRISFDCRYYSGDKPCSFSKEELTHCSVCNHYTPAGKSVLIIKLGAPGDVLRTTPLLYEIKRKYPNAYITWITQKDSFPLLENNPFIDRLWDTSAETICRLQTETFELVLSLENAGACASLASLALGVRKVGYGVSGNGWIIPFNKEAETYLEMAVFDDVKKANVRTYQELIFDICGYRFDPQFHKVILPLTVKERDFAAGFARQNSLNASDLVIGINLGSGGRWPMKRWLTSRFAKLIERLTVETAAKILLLGGPEEMERSREMKQYLSLRGISVIDGRCDNTLRQFMALVDLCDLVVTGDTLAMHIAIALEKRVIALFGPTSATEIELYGRGARVVSPVDCQCCYRKECSVTPNCMEAIAVDDVMAVINSSLKRQYYLQEAV